MIQVSTELLYEEGLASIEKALELQPDFSNYFVAINGLFDRLSSRKKPQIPGAKDDSSED